MEHMKSEELLDGKSAKEDLRRLIGYVWAEGNLKREFPTEDMELYVNKFCEKHCNG